LIGSIETDFRPQLTSLDKKKFTVVGWDPPGYGKSRPPNRDLSDGVKMFYDDARLAEALMKVGINMEQCTIFVYEIQCSQ
jgi:valacyclovir hydrolase